MICSPCRATKELPACLQRLHIGIVQATTDYDVYIRDVTTGRIEKYTSTSNGSGLLSFDFAQRCAVNHAYELWVVLKDASVEDRVDVLISGEVDPYQCFSISFESTFTGGAKNTYTEATLTAG